MCELSGVSRAGFYRHWEASAPQQADTALRDAIQQVIVAKRFYGYRRVQQELRQCGHCVNAKRVLRLMREDNLLCLRARRFVPATTDSQHGWRVWPNLARGLVTRNLNELWVADITYVRLQEEFVYVAVVLDAHSRRVIGWALAQHLGASLAVQALRMALTERKPAPGLIHHSDRGIPVRLRRLSHAARRSRRATEHESGGQPLRQRQGRIFHENSETRAGSRQRLARSRSTASRPSDILRHHLQPPAAAFGVAIPNASRFRTAITLRQEARSFYRADWGEGANRPLAPDPTPRFTISKLSLISMSQLRGAVQQREFELPDYPI